MKELAGVALILAIPFGARAILEVAWYRYQSRATKGTHIGWGPDSIGLPRPIFLGVAAGLVLAAAALLVVVDVQFGAADLFGVVFLALGVLLLIAVGVTFGVIYGKWVGRVWWRRATRDSFRK
jgi:hypothetical protein